MEVSVDGYKSVRAGSHLLRNINLACGTFCRRAVEAKAQGGCGCVWVTSAVAQTLRGGWPDGAGCHSPAPASHRCEEAAKVYEGRLFRNDGRLANGGRSRRWYLLRDRVPLSHAREWALIRRASELTRRHSVRSGHWMSP